MLATTTPSLSLSNSKIQLKPTICLDSLGLFQEESTNFGDSLQTPEDISQEIVSSDSEAIVSSGGQDGVALIIQVLLFVAFLAPTHCLTIGVVYIGVSEFLGKREREKFEKDEAAKRSKKGGKKKAMRAKGGKKKAMRAKAGPRSFGQKIEVDDIDIDLE